MEIIRDQKSSQDTQGAEEIHRSSGEKKAKLKQTNPNKKLGSGSIMLQECFCQG